MNLKMVMRQSIVASIYVVFTVVLQPISYGEIQFRLSEVLVLLCFFRKDYVYGLTLGCFIANFFSPFWVFDVPIGTLATLLALFGIMYSKRLWIASIFPVVLNGIIIGIELHFLYDLPLIPAMLSVAFGEFIVVSVAGIILFSQLKRNKGFMGLIEANQNYEFESME